MDSDGIELSLDTVKQALKDPKDIDKYYHITRSLDCLKRNEWDMASKYLKVLPQDKDNYCEFYDEDPEMTAEKFVEKYHGFD